MNDLLQNIVYGGGLTVFLVSIVIVPYIIGYKQGRATAKEVALDTLHKLWVETELLQRKFKVEETADKNE